MNNYFLVKEDGKLERIYSRNIKKGMNFIIVDDDGNRVKSLNFRFDFFTADEDFDSLPEDAKYAWVMV
jgi:hypothetical protein